MAEGLELGDQAAGFAFGVQALGEVVGAELVVGFAGGQDVPDDYAIIAWATTTIAFFLAVWLR
jgi:hypothetical protein